MGSVVPSCVWQITVVEVDVDVVLVVDVEVVVVAPTMVVLVVVGTEVDVVEEVVVVVGQLDWTNGSPLTGSRSMMRSSPSVYDTYMRSPW
jgi:hypothetical protein